MARGALRTYFGKPPGGLIPLTLQVLRYAGLHALLHYDASLDLVLYLALWRSALRSGK